MSAYTMAKEDAEILDLNDLVDEKTGIRHIGIAKKQPDGTWHCLANVNGALVMVEITVTKMVKGGKG